MIEPVSNLGRCSHANSIPQSIDIGYSVDYAALDSDWLVMCFFIYFVLGYFLFASLHVIGGALSTDNESGNIVAQVLPNLSMIPFFTAPAVIQTPPQAAK